MALPVIATQWSGPQEYMTEENSYPLRIAGLEPIAEGAFAGHLWAVPDKVELQRLMRQVCLAVLQCFCSRPSLP